MNYGIQYQSLSGRIDVGRLNKAETMFLDGKQDCTGQAIWAVGQWLLEHDDGEPYEITNARGETVRFTIERVPEGQQR